MTACCLALPVSAARMLGYFCSQRQSRQIARVGIAAMAVIIGLMGERMYSLSAGERDRLIATLRGKGWPLGKIGARVGMSRSGVLRALERIERGDPGVDRRAY